MQNPNPQTVSEETGMDTDVTTWALPEGAIARLGRGRVETLGLSPDGKYLAVGTWIGLWWYELATMKPVDLWETERGMISALEFSPNGALLATGNWDGGVKVWDVQNHRCLAKMQRTGLFDRASELVFSPDGQRLASSGGKYDAIYIWHPETGEQIAKFTVDEELQPRHRPTRIPLAFSPDGKFLIGATPENTFEFTTDQESQWLVAFSPKGDFLVCASSKGGLYVWDGAEKQTQIPVNPGHITSLSISPDGKHIAIAYFDKVAEVWDIRSAKQVADLSVTWTRDTTKYKGDAHQVQRCLEQIKKTPEHSSLPSMQIKGPIVFSPDGATIAGGLFREIRLWDAATHETCMAIRVPQGCQRPEALTFSPCGRYLVSGASWQGTDKMSIRLWEVATGENIVTFWGHPTDVQDLAFSPDGTLLASGSYDGTILLWDMKPYLSPIDPHCPETK